MRFTVEQELWLEIHYANTSNAECARHCGCGWRTIVRKARAMGWRKSREFMEQSWRRSVNAMRIMNKGEGNRGKTNLILYGEKYRFKKGENYKDRCDAEQWSELHRKAQETRRAIIKSERLRINWGFEQKTKMRLVRQPQQWVNYRCSMKRRGYVVYRGSREIYYNDNTNRSAVVERNAQAAGLIILQANGLQCKTTQRL